MSDTSGTIQLTGHFQLPLSGSLADAARGPSSSAGHAFNSLSRDHCSHSQRRQAPAPDFQLPLSGSLKNREVATWETRKAFNSLSRDHSGWTYGDTTLGVGDFQLPLSGSRDVLTLVQAALKVDLSTPSLGITEERRGRRGGGGSGSFNSLSRDHRARFRDFSALRGFLPRHPFAQMIPKATI